MESLKNFVTYKSSAGSGKTYTLVKEFLKIVFQSDNPKRYRNILAITFTNKAANEMKERVIENLKILSESIDSELMESYSEDFGLEKHIIKQKAGKVLQSVLHNYSDLKISTIDKFTYKIIRAFSKDLNLSTDFDIEMDKEKILIQAIDLMISRAGEDEKLSRLLIDFLDHKIDNEENWKIEDAILEFGKELTDETNEEYLKILSEVSEEDFKEIKSFLSKNYKEAKSEIENLGKTVIELFTRNGLTEAEFPSGTIYKFFQNMEKGEIIKILDPNKTLLKAINEDKWLHAKPKPEAKNAMDGISDEVRSYYFELESTSKNYFLYELLNKNIFNLMLIKELYTSINTIKEEENILMISDFNKLISKEIKNQPAPFIYEKIGERYKNIMIDEFQDTSVLQWHNLLPLVDNALSMGNKTLLVGDAKQAIYRFRGGKVEQFVELPKLIDKSDDILLDEREIALHNNHQNEVLDTNYRSHSQVIDFNNWFFERLKNFLEEDKQKIYQEQKQEKNKKDEGLVNISFIPYNKEEINDLYLEKTKEKIDECLEDGFQLKDIALLVNKNKYGSLLSNYLINEGYKVITSESLLIEEDKEVNFVINFLRFVQNNNDNTAKLALIKYFFQEEKFSPALLTYSKKIKNKADIKIMELLKSLNPEFNLIRLFELSLYDLTETIIREFIPNLEKTNSFLVKLLDVVHSYSSKRNDLMEFLTYWDKNSYRISLETPADNAITIMTVHKSKGLQFPVVISSFTSWTFYSSFTTNKWVELGDKIPKLPIGILPLTKTIKATDYAYLKEIEDEQIKLDKFNLLYVALTRPEKRLYVISDDNVLSYKKYKDNIISSFLHQICATHENYNEGELTIGERKKHVSKEEKADDLFPLSEMTTTNWREKIRISQQYQELWGESGYKEKIAYGNLIHNILSKVEKREDLTQVIKSFSEQGLIKNEELAEFESEIGAILEDNQIKKWFDGTGEILNEKDILSKEGKLYRPDKVIVYKDKTVVIDFKTGEKQDSYSKQITNYGNLLSEMGYKNIEKYLLYTKDKSVVQIP